MKFVFESNTIGKIGLLMLTTLKRMQVMLSSSLDKLVKEPIEFCTKLAVC